MNKKYNNIKHSTIGITPLQAKQGNNNMEVWLHIRNKAEFNRKCPPLEINDMVRTYIKPHTFKKGYISAWSNEVYKIIHISDDKKQFLINDNKKRVYNRHELLKIKGAEGKND